MRLCLGWGLGRLGQACRLISHWLRCLIGRSDSPQVGGPLVFAHSVQIFLQPASTLLWLDPAGGTDEKGRRDTGYCE
jgi:hypothetical protein